MILSVILIIICVLLILVVMVQNSKGGGISSNFTAANQIMGARRGTDFIEKATWTLAILLLIFSLLSTPKTGGVQSSDGTSQGSVTKQKAGGAVMPAAQPAAPAAQPAAPAEQPAQPAQ
jgi:preprotein translocase subunit SecG